MRDPGVRLQLKLGANTLAPAPYDVMDALLEVEVTNNDLQRDGFQMTFSLSRTRKMQEHTLLKDGLLDPKSRVCIIVLIQGKSQVLINGVITKHQVIPSQEPGQSRLVVTGEDTGHDLDRNEKNNTHLNQSDSRIVEAILRRYRGFEPDVTSTSPTPSEAVRIVTQYHTDLAFIQRLAEKNSFVFFTEPTGTPGVSTAYWGRRDRAKVPVQPALNINMGSETNIVQISFDFNAFEPLIPETEIIDPKSQSTLSIPSPDPQDSPLARRKTDALRTKPLRSAAKLDSELARKLALQARSKSAHAVTVQGELDVTLYGRVLRSRRKVDVRGAGKSYDGTYYVSQVTHRIKRGEYRQSFTLTREGLGAQSTTVTQ